MPTGRIHIDPALPAAEGLARGLSLLQSVTTERPVLLYGAPLDGAAVVLGGYQHAPHALRAEAFDAIALPVLRRQTGGAAVWGGQGVLYLALCLREASVLMPCPAGRILNRNVRGFLAGVRALGVPTHYFGRDFLSFGTEPGAYVGWDESSDGRVLLEFFVGLDTVFAPATELDGYPQRVEPALRGKQPTTLRAAGMKSASAGEVIAGIADGYARSFAIDLESEALSAEEVARAASLRAQLTVDLHDEHGLCWSSPHEDAIGFVSAGARLDARGRLSALQLAGDFFQHRGCPAQLAERTLGIEPSEEAIGAALDAVYGQRPGMIEGVRSLRTLRTAVLEAARQVHARQ